MAGFDYSGGKYPILKPNFDSDIQWICTVAEIVQTGVVAGAGSGPSTPANSSQSTGPVTGSRTTSSTVTPGSLVSTTRGASLTSSSNSASSTITSAPLCGHFADPDMG